MSGTAIQRDERTMAVENAGYRWSYLVLSFGLLVIVAIRSFAQHQQSWDLLALVVLGGGVNAGFQALHKVVYRRWVILAAVTMVVAALLAVVMARLGSAQTPPASSAIAMPRDSLLNCAARMAATAGFRQVLVGPAGRIGMMRPRDNGGTAYPLDGMRLSLAAPDSAHVDVRVTTFLVSRSTGINQAEVAPPPALTALADSIRLRCRQRGSP